MGQSVGFPMDFWSLFFSFTCFCLFGRSVLFLLFNGFSWWFKLIFSCVVFTSCAFVSAFYFEKRQASSDPWPF